MKTVEAVKILAGALGLLCWACPGFLRAQAPPGPLPQVQSKDAAPAPPSIKPKPQLPPRQSILGAWKLNRDDSDDPRQKMQDARGSSSQGGYGGRGHGGGGYPGGGGGGRGGYGGRGQSSESDEAR